MGVGALLPYSHREEKLKGSKIVQRVSEVLLVIKKSSEECNTVIKNYL